MSLGHLDAANLLAILGMALATFACRAGGYWLFRLIRPTPWLRAVLGYLPGTLFVSFVVPALADGQPSRLVGAAVTVAIMVASGSLVAAILGGTAAAWIAWASF